MSLIKLGDFETALSFLNDPRNHPNQNIDPNIILMVLSHCKIDLSESHEYFRHILGKSEISDQYGVLYELITVIFLQIFISMVNVFALKK